jgi:hypothetical protein
MSLEEILRASMLKINQIRLSFRKNNETEKKISRKKLSALYLLFALEL